MNYSQCHSEDRRNLHHQRRKSIQKSIGGKFKKHFFFHGGIGERKKQQPRIRYLKFRFRIILQRYIYNKHNNSSNNNQ